MTRVYFTDRDLGKQFPRILAEAGIAVERHGDLFRPEGSDEECPPCQYDLLHLPL